MSTAHVGPVGRHAPGSRLALRRCAAGRGIASQRMALALLTPHWPRRRKTGAPCWVTGSACLRACSSKSPVGPAGQRAMNGPDLLRKRQRSPREGRRCRADGAAELAARQVSTERERSVLPGQDPAKQSQLPAPADHARDPRGGWARSRVAGRTSCAVLSALGACPDAEPGGGRTQRCRARPRAPKDR